MRFLSICIPLILLSIILGAFKTISDDKKPVVTFVTDHGKDNNVFAFKLFNQLSNKSKGNVFISPYSISTALAMTYAGSEHATQKEMMNTLNFKENTPSFHRSYGQYSTSIIENAKGKIQLNIANRLWGDKKYKLQDDFISLTKEAYGSGLEKLNFKTDFEGSRKIINSWVEEMTKDRIKDLLPSGSVNSSTKLILTNAIYFKADWLYKFDEKKTRDRILPHDGRKEKEDSIHEHQRRIRLLPKPAIQNDSTSVQRRKSKYDHDFT